MTPLYRATLSTLSRTAPGQVSLARAWPGVPAPGRLGVGNGQPLLPWLATSGAGVQRPEPPAGLAHGPAGATPELAAPKRYTWVIRSSSDADDNGFALSLSGVELDHYRANPVLLLNHMAEAPIGLVQPFLRAGRLMAHVELATHVSLLAAYVAGMVDAGVLRGASVGGRTLQGKLSRDGRTMVVTRWSLVEVSLTPVPADRAALRVM